MKVIKLLPLALLITAQAGAATVGRGDVDMSANVDASITCAMSPVSVVFPDFTDSSEEEIKLTQSVDVTCENIPAGASVRLFHDGNINKTKFGDTITNPSIKDVSGLNVNIQKGVIMSSLKSQLQATSSLSKTFRFPVDFYLKVKDSDDLRMHLLDKNLSKASISETISIGVAVDTP